jgi:hypothetical protein
VEKVLSSSDLMRYISNMNSDNSVCQVLIPGKGKFTIVLQEEDQRSIAKDVEANPLLKEMIQESMEAYKEGRTMTTPELIKSLSPKDFTK